MKRKKYSFTIEVKPMKVRQPFAPKQKAFKNRKAYSRQAFKNID